jgi:hypothetical protein
MKQKNRKQQKVASGFFMGFTGLPVRISELLICSSRIRAPVVLYRLSIEMNLQPPKAFGGQGASLLKTLQLLTA